MAEDNSILWKPSEKQIAGAEVTAFMRMLSNKDIILNNFSELYDWSINDSQSFWSHYWDFANIVGNKGATVLVNEEDIEKAVWFPDAKLNFAENLLQHFLINPQADKTAIHFKAENKKSYSLSEAELIHQVTLIAGWLKSQGVQKGDRVAAYMGNTPEAVVAMLAATSLGAIWTSISPDFGAQSVIERFGQTNPKILFTPVIM